ncbi:choline/ethanolamine kinase family protein [Haploplasma axanthum]|uniref:CTP:phosphocholine cytidylyltransferase involved in choline phosphorylation for cell surface LPS epitopes n=1 Tax=Haploplasma axanthum TaxID=29552 RepID=A0A449BE46_HAPAX|nr:choline/ethanolamine kinase family protein [Haploplasma axanthum]VEU80702.1 CTP:phosphocholine cytidylyltransferase involved in choline phosphorylation for cell surface LPS epitopes [Haploplasma axanthum]
MDTKIKKEIVKIFNVKESKIKDLKRFSKGMSNYTYYFKINDKAYVIRVIGDDADRYVDYHNEINAISAVLSNQLTSKLVYFDIETGTKVSEYIDGETIDFETKNFDIKELVFSLKKLHLIKNENIKNYALIDRLNEYESFNKISDISKPYFALKTWWIEVFNKYYRNNEQVFCHNDLQDANIVRSSDDNKIYFIDFEYAAYNDVYYDIAGFEENALYVHSEYFGHPTTEKEKNHVIFYRIFQSLQWYQVALYKHKIGFSENTSYDFNELANYFINKALSLYEEIKAGEF